MKKMTALIIILSMIISILPINIAVAERYEDLTEEDLIKEADCTEEPIFFDDFENGLDQWKCVGVAADEECYTLSPAFPCSGSYSLRVDDTVTTESITLATKKKFTLTPGEDYTVLVDYYGFSGSGTKIYLRMFDIIDGKETRIDSWSVVPIENYKVWQPLSLVFRAPDYVKTAEFYVTGAAAALSTSYFDNIRIRKGKVQSGTDVATPNTKLLKTSQLKYDTVYDMPAFTPPDEHPRVYFTKKDIPTIKENALKPQNKSAYQRLLTEISSKSTGHLSSKVGDNLNDKTMGIIQAKAFYYAVWGDEEKGKEAVSMLNNFLNDANPQGSEYNSQGYLVFTIAAVYDWCYPLLTAADKRYFQNMGLITASTMECGYPPTIGSVLNGHSAEAMILRDQMAFALATYGDRNDIYQNVGGRYFSESVPSIKFLADAKSSSFGNSYITYRHQWEVMSAFMMRALGIPDIYGENHRYVMYWLLYSRRPDGSSLHDGDSISNNRNFKEYDERGTRTFFLAGNFYKDPYLKGEYLRHNTELIIGENTDNNSLSSIEVLCFNDPDLDYKPVRELPLSMYYPAPRGDMIARTSWSDGIDAPAVVAQMKVDEYWTQGHDHLDSGEFEIYYKGALANDTGYYQAGRVGSSKENSGNTVYGTVHFYNYHRRTIAHNCMVVYDPNEDAKTSYKGYSNDGGQIFANGEASLLNSAAITEANHIASVLAKEFGPDLNQPEYTYIKGDIAKAYGEKVPEYERSFMFLNLKNDKTPAAMIVFDRMVSKNKNADKKWVLHGLFEPEINGTRVVFKDTRDGYNGKLTLDTLLPKADNYKVSTVGKEDWEYIDPDTGTKYIGQSFEVDGTDYWGQALTGKFNEGGGYRIEVSPKTKKNEDYFLNVLQVADADSKDEPLESEMIESTTHTGVKIADRVVLFGNEKDKIFTNISFEIKGEGTYKFTIADLKEGTWNVKKDGNDFTQAVATKDGGVLSFEGDAGEYLISYVNKLGTKEFTNNPLPKTEGINVKFDKANKYVYMEVDPFTENDNMFVSANSIYTAMGADVSYDENSGVFTAKNDSITVTVTKDSDTALINGVSTKMPAKAKLKDGKLVLPVYFALGSFGYSAKWDEYSKTLFITKKATITYNPSNSRASIFSTEEANYYVATYDGKKLTKIKKYSVSAGRTSTVSVQKGQVIYVWFLDKFSPVGEKFVVE